MDEQPKSEQEQAAGRAWFNSYSDKLEHGSVVRPKAESKYACPCCGYRTLSERGGFDICQVCYWEDDGQDDHDTEQVRGGPNGALSLTAARENFRLFQASDPKFVSNVRPPTYEEKRG
jgi:hypothetical protein